MAKKKMQELLNIEESVKEKVKIIAPETARTLEGGHHFNGYNKNYKPTEENGFQFPPDSKPVQSTVKEKVNYYFESMMDLVKTIAAKEMTNASTKADLILPNGTVILKNAPAPLFLSLEKWVRDVRSVLVKMPTLDPADEWSKEEGSQDIYRSKPVPTQKTQKVVKPLVLYPATDKFPAQTDKISEDVLVGIWETIKRSGNITSTEKAEILNRCDELERACKEAKARANDIEIIEVPDIEKKLKSFIMNGTVN